MSSSTETLAQNPVTGAEISHIQRKQSPAALINWLNRLLWWGLLAGSAGMVLFCVGLAISNPLIYAAPPGQYYLPITHALGLLALGAFYAHFRLMFQTLDIAANSIAREKRGSTWESLLLTGIDARQIVVGKWRAILTLTRRDYLRLALVRIGVTIGIGTLVVTEPRLGFSPLPPGPSGIILLHMLLAAGFIFVLTLLNGVLTAAAGVLAGFFTRDQTPGQTSGMATRMVLLLMPVLLLLIPVLYVILTIPPETASPLLQDAMNTVMFMQVGLIDNGTIITAGIANPLDDWLLRYVMAVAGIMLIQGFLTWFALRYACWLAKRQGAA